MLIFNFRGNAATLIETRPYFRDPTIWTESPIAQFRFDIDEKVWLLFCRDRNTRWHHYDLIAPSADLVDLIAEVEQDPTRIFWG